MASLPHVVGIKAKDEMERPKFMPTFNCIPCCNFALFLGYKLVEFVLQEAQLCSYHVHLFSHSQPQYFDYKKGSMLHLTMFTT